MDGEIDWNNNNREITPQLRNDIPRFYRLVMRNNIDMRRFRDVRFVRELIWILRNDDRSYRLMVELIVAVVRRNMRMEHATAFQNNTEEVFRGSGLADAGSRSFVREEMEGREGLFSQASRASPLLINRARRHAPDEVNAWENGNIE